MRTTIALALCLAAVPLSSSATQAAPEPAVRGAAAPSQAPAAGVREAERLRAQALAQRDIETLRRLISGDYYHVESNGRVRTKAEFLQALARDEYRIRGYGVDEMEIRVVDDGGTAIVTGTYRATSMDPPSTPLRGRYVRVWTRHPDGWRNALHQGTQLHTVASRPSEAPARALQ